VGALLGHLEGVVLLGILREKKKIHMWIWREGSYSGDPEGYAK